MCQWIIMSFWTYRPLYLQQGWHIPWKVLEFDCCLIFMPLPLGARGFMFSSCLSVCSKPETGLGSIPFFQFNSNSISTTHNKLQFQFQFQRFQFQFQCRRFQIQSQFQLWPVNVFLEIDYDYNTQWNLSVITTSITKYITCDLFSDVF